MIYNIYNKKVGLVYNKICILGICIIIVVGVILVCRIIN